MNPKPRLQSLIFEVTQRCNHACMHCYNAWHANRSYPQGELDTARTVKLLGRALDQTTCSHVTLTGGEPLLRTDLPELLEYLQQRRVRMTVISNGRLISREKAVELVRLGTGLFELPLLSSRCEVHDELSGARGAWDAVLSAMTHIRLAGGQVVCSFVATRRNIEEIHETMRLAFAFGARGFMLNRFNPGGRGRERLEELLPTAAQVRQALETAQSASAEFHLPVSASIPIQPCIIDLGNYPVIGCGYCAAGTERAYYTIDPLGNMRPCNHTDLVLGNLFECTFEEMIASPQMCEFKEALPLFCRACARQEECRGGCKAAAGICYGSITEEEPFLKHNHPAAPIRM